MAQNSSSPTDARTIPLHASLAHLLSSPSLSDMMSPLLPLTISSSTCTRCARPLLLPPPLSLLQDAYPSLPAFPIDRTLPRCRYCDLRRTQKLLVSAELPPPKYTNPVAKVEADIKKMEELIKEGIMVEELRIALPVARRRWGERVMEREQGKRRAWEAFWGVWGPGAGQREGSEGVYMR